MKTKTILSISLLAVLAACSGAQSTPPSVLTFQPGSSWAIDFVGLPAAHGHSFQTSACLSTTFGQLPLNDHFSLVSDVLAGINLSSNGGTIGYGLGLQYQAGFKIGATQFYGFVKVGGANLFTAGQPGVLGFELAAGVSIPTR